jgi:cell division protein FtsA
MSGVRLEVDTHIVTASSPALKNLSKTVKEVGIEIEDTVFSGYASSFSTLSRTEKELGCVLIDIGSGTTSVAAFVEGGLSFSGAIPIGARNVTNDLAIGLRVSLEKAEKIKKMLSKRIKEEEAKKFDQIEISEEGSREIKKVARRTLIEGIVKPRLNEIFTMIKIDLERAGIINRVPSGAIITGGGALTNSAGEQAKKILGLPTRIAVPGGVSGLTDEILNPPFSAAIGLIIYASESERNYVSKSYSGSNKKLKLPSHDIFSKIVESIKDLLP